jgi:hypothetical protein
MARLEADREGRYNARALRATPHLGPVLVTAHPV